MVYCIRYGPRELCVFQVIEELNLGYPNDMRCKSNTKVFINFERRGNISII